MWQTTESVHATGDVLYEFLHPPYTQQRRFLEESMSWDVFIQDLPPEARSVRDIPDAFQPQALGQRGEIIERIKRTFPDADFSDAAWGRIHRQSFSVDVSITEDGDLIHGVTLHVRGSDDAVDAVVRLIDAIGGRAVDSWTGELFDQAVALHSLRRWRAYLEEI